MTRLIIHYRSAFFRESQQVADPANAIPGAPRGLVGRQVANREMLRAILRYGRDDQLTFVVDDESDYADAKAELSASLPEGKRAIIKRLRGSESWLASAKDAVFWEPQPPSEQLAHLRHRVGGTPFAISGITHALCSSTAVAAVRGLATAPFQSFDRLVCTSSAVAHTARSLLEHTNSHSQESSDSDQIGLETIPLGVDCRRHRPATPQQRRSAREQLKIGDDEETVLFMGRLSHHAKSNPLPMYFGCQAAHQRSGRRIVLILAGWYANTAVKDAFQTEAKRLAPSVRVIHVDGMDPIWRESVWFAADLFVSLADSVQETFGLTVVEAMSRKLPVIATDWNGYRETVRHGQTGLLVPTSIVDGAGQRGLQALHEGRLTYDQFLAAASQVVRVDPHAVADAISRLVAHHDERKTLVEAGFRHVRRSFDWSVVIAKYEELWERQRARLRRQRMTQSSSAIAPSAMTPPSQPIAHHSSPTRPYSIPSFRKLFERYPSMWIGDDQRFKRGPAAFGNQSEVVASPLASHGSQWRANEEELQAFVDAIVAASDLNRTRDHLQFADTLAWTHKYDLVNSEIRPRVRVVTTEAPIGQSKDNVNAQLKSVFAIPHFCRRIEVGAGRHGSQFHGPTRRGTALANTVLALHQLFSKPQAMIQVGERKTIPANQTLLHHLDVFIVTTGGNHALPEADLPAEMYHHIELDTDPSELGFGCHRALAKEGDQADFGCYMEDDLVIRDPLWFEKLRWFNEHLGNENLLLPNRYEVSRDSVYKKCYLDGDLAPRVTAAMQNVNESPNLYGKSLGRTVRFARPLNPHAGCFFLNRTQLKRWTNVPQFGDPRRDFIGPLESAATRSLMQAFRIYKPAAENASWLEIEHQGDQFIRKVRSAAR